MKIQPEIFGQILKKHFTSQERLFQWLLTFYNALSTDVMVGYFFDGKDLAAIAQQQSAFLWKVGGLSKSYLGKAPATAHLALPPIWAGHFDRRLLILKDLLEKKGLSLEEIHTWIEVENTFRASIIDPHPPK
jgi:truncated hemoglobin YjbI